MAVEGLLIEQLGFEKVGHARGAGTIVVTVQSQVLPGLLDATPGQQELLIGFLDSVAGVLHADLQQLAAVL